ncbi:hypothetical protein GCM10020255_003650 [Rhodococcus baikonurensis]
MNAGQSEEEIKAYVRLVDGSDELPQDLATWVSQRLAAFKVPRYWQFVTELPYTQRAGSRSINCPSTATSTTSPQYAEQEL